MKRCPITYQPLAESHESRYSREGLRMLAKSLTRLHDLPYSAEEQRHEAMARATKLSIQGVQPKLSARLLIKEGRFEIVDQGGRYILKPQNQLFRNLPENEDLTMRLAETAGIEVPFHGMVFSADGSLTYFVKRFDRVGRNRKLAVEDFAQLSGRTRDTKYDSTMERLIPILERHCTFPAVEKLELFRRTLFCYLTGNEDMHLKNFSLIVRDGITKLSPAYDLLNTTIALPGVREELALPLRGKKSKLNRDDLVQYLGVERLELPERAIVAVLASLSSAQKAGTPTIEASFLPFDLKEKYVLVLQERAAELGLDN